jgi:hypothetical protein
MGNDKQGGDLNGRCVFAASLMNDAVVKSDLIGAGIAAVEKLDENRERNFVSNDSVRQRWSRLLRFPMYSSMMQDRRVVDTD